MHFSSIVFNLALLSSIAAVAVHSRHHHHQHHPQHSWFNFVPKFFGFGSRCNKCNGESDKNPIRLHNWGGNFNFSTQNIQYPRNVQQVQQIVRNAGKLRVIGSRHSFSKIADSPCTLLSTIGLNRIIGINSSIPSVTVQGGLTYTDLVTQLDSAGFALPNIASISDISVAGAAATNAHGSGVENQALANHIRSMELVVANGTLLSIGPNDPRLKAMAVSLGAFGVVTQLELTLVPKFNITTFVYVNVPEQNLFDNFKQIQTMGFNALLVNSFATPNLWNTMIINARSDSNITANLTNNLFGATLVSQTEQPWYKGMLSFTLGLAAVDGDEIQTEYFLPFSNAVPALKAISALINTTTNIFPSPATAFVIRTIKADDLWMSEYYGNETMVAIHFSWLNNVTAVQAVLPQIERVLIPFGARPHWGKLFTMEPEDFLPHYPKVEQFRQLAEEMDPKGKFRNEFLEQNVWMDVDEE